MSESEAANLRKPLFEQPEKKSCDVKKPLKITVKSIGILTSATLFIGLAVSAALCIANKSEFYALLDQVWRFISGHSSLTYDGRFANHSAYLEETEGSRTDEERNIEYGLCAAVGVTLLAAFSYSLYKHRVMKREKDSLLFELNNLKSENGNDFYSKEQVAFCKMQPNELLKFRLSKFNKKVRDSEQGLDVLLKSFILSKDASCPLGDFLEKEDVKNFLKSILLEEMNVAVTLVESRDRKASLALFYVLCYAHVLAVNEPSVSSGKDVERVKFEKALERITDTFSGEIAADSLWADVGEKLGAFQVEERQQECVEITCR